MRKKKESKRRKGKSDKPEKKENATVQNAKKISRNIPCAFNKF